MTSLKVFGHLEEEEIVVFEDSNLKREGKKSVSKIDYDDIINSKVDGNEALKVTWVDRSSTNWKLRTLKLIHSENEVLLRWNAELIRRFQNDRRPEKLLFFINPFGGKGKAEKIFKKRVKPLLEISGIQFKMVLTERKNHARDLIVNWSRLEEEFNGIVSVGGDGMFGEIFNGLLTRGETFNGTKEKVRVGVIPAGSTDALALSIHGTRDPQTCAMHIILGEERNVDACAIYSKEDNGSYVFDRYSMGMISYGYFGNLLKSSENLRWMGPIRYDLCGIRAFLANKSYEGVVSFICFEDEQKDIVCNVNCPVCKINVTNENIEENLVSKETRGKFMGVTVATLSCACSKAPDGIAPFAHLGDGKSHLVMINQCSRRNYFKYLMRTSISKTQSPFSLSFVDVYRIKEMTFQPGDGRCSVWNCDGEMINTPSIKIQVMRQAVPLFACGIRKQKTNNKNRRRSLFLTSILNNKRSGESLACLDTHQSPPIREKPP